MSFRVNVEGIEGADYSKTCKRKKKGGVIIKFKFKTKLAGRILEFSPGSSGISADKQSIFKRRRFDIYSARFYNTLES